MFNPRQPRGADGKWIRSGSGSVRRSKKILSAAGAEKRNVRRAQRKIVANYVKSKSRPHVKRAKRNIKRTAAGKRYSRLSTRQKRIVKGAAIAGGVAAVALTANHVNYRRKYTTVYHRTSFENAGRIVRSRKWNSDTHNRGHEGTSTGIWFSKSGRWGASNSNFGPATVKIKRVPNSALVSHKKVMRQHTGNPKLRGRVNGVIPDWTMVDSKVVNGMKATQVKRPIARIMPLVGNNSHSRAIRASTLKTAMQLTAPNMAYVADNWAGKPVKRKKRK